ncbi:histidinol dehydrogenase, partial [Salinivibrio sp. PR919]
MRTVVWKSLGESQKEGLMRRPAITTGAQTQASVAEIIADVRERGDESLKALTQKFDGVELDSIKLDKATLADAEARLDEDIKLSLRQAYDNISTFHRAQKAQPLKVETMPGVVCESITRPINR